MSNKKALARAFSLFKQLILVFFYKGTKLCFVGAKPLLAVFAVKALVCLWRKSLGVYLVSYLPS